MSRADHHRGRFGGIDDERLLMQWERVVTHVTLFSGLRGEDYEIVLMVLLLVACFPSGTTASNVGHSNLFFSSSSCLFLLNFAFLLSVCVSVCRCHMRQMLWRSRRGRRGGGGLNEEDIRHCDLLLVCVCVCYVLSLSSSLLFSWLALVAVVIPLAPPKSPPSLCHTFPRTHNITGWLWPKLLPS